MIDSGGNRAAGVRYFLLVCQLLGISHWPLSDSNRPPKATLLFTTGPRPTQRPHVAALLFSHRAGPKHGSHLFRFLPSPLQSGRVRLFGGISHGKRAGQKELADLFFVGEGIIPRRYRILQYLLH
jgi:hypothetical protein